MEHIHKKKAENLRSKQLAWVQYTASDVMHNTFTNYRMRTHAHTHTRTHTHSDQAEARRNKVKQSRLRREERQKQKREELLKQYAKEDEASKTPK